MAPDSGIIQLGIMGLSEGNGHPYSWSAIINGYNPEAMRGCPFPVIPEYLAKQKFPEDAISEATVTHVWTQDRALSEHIAAAARIPNIAACYEDMLGRVDGILLARDDPENHYAMSAPFLDAGLPVYVDKPLAVTRAEAERLFSRQQYRNQIFTCSALAFAREFMLSDEDRREIGAIRRVEASVMKDWCKYSPHIIDPVLNLIGDQGAMVRMNVTRKEELRTVEVIWESGLETSFASLGPQTRSIEISVIGEHGSRRLVFADTFAAFKGALQAFIDVIKKRRQAPSREMVMQMVAIIEAGA